MHAMFTEKQDVLHSLLAAVQIVLQAVVVCDEQLVVVIVVV